MVLMAALQGVARPLSGFALRGSELQTDPSAQRHLDVAPHVPLGILEPTPLITHHLITCPPSPEPVSGVCLQTWELPGGGAGSIRLAVHPGH